MEEKKGKKAENGTWEGRKRRQKELKQKKMEGNGKAGTTEEWEVVNMYTQGGRGIEKEVGKGKIGRE